MAIDQLKGVKISAVCCAVPGDILKAEDFYAVMPRETVDRFVKDAGIKQKFYSKNRTTITSDLCVAAAEKIFKTKEVDRKSIDALIFITQTPDFPTPTTSSTLQYRLNLSQECMAYDVNLGCSAYVYGLHLAASKMQSGYIKRVLLLVGDISHGMRVPPLLDDLLFGDCGSATLLEVDENVPDIKFQFQTMGSGFKAIGAIEGIRFDCVGNPPPNPALWMDGVEIVSFGITKVPKLIKDFTRTFNLQLADFEAFLLHQANLSMLKRIIKKANLPQDKTPLCMEKYGNTSCASIPNLMCEIYGGKQYSGNKRTLMVGFGIGLSLGIIDIHIDTTNILPIFTTDLTWEEGRSKIELTHE